MPDRGADEAVMCPFCMIVAGLAPAEVLHKNSAVVVIKPLNPATLGHALVIPRLHLTSAEDDPATTGAVFVHATHYGSRFDAFNLLTSVGIEATQTVKHLHVHVIPRGGRHDQLPPDWPWMRDG